MKLIFLRSSLRSEFRAWARARARLAKVLNVSNHARALKTSERGSILPVLEDRSSRYIALCFAAGFSDKIISFALSRAVVQRERSAADAANRNVEKRAD